MPAQKQNLKEHQAFVQKQKPEGGRKSSTRFLEHCHKCYSPRSIARALFFAFLRNEKYWSVYGNNTDRQDPIMLAFPSRSTKQAIAKPPWNMVAERYE